MGNKKTEISTQWDRRAKVFDKSIVQGELKNRRFFEKWKNLIQEALGDKIPYFIRFFIQNRTLLGNIIYIPNNIRLVAN